MLKSESILNLLPAIISAKQKFGTINKNKSGYGYKYATIDEILDKISQSGYDCLTKEEKEFLFKAGK